MDNVIKIAEHSVTVKRDQFWERQGQCEHKNKVMDGHGQVVRCKDCGSNLSAYWVLERMLDSFEEERAKMKLARERLKEDQDAIIVLKAAKTAQAAWRKRDMVPSCPHCRRGIMATDRFGESKVSKELEERRRKDEPPKRY